MVIILFFGLKVMIWLLVRIVIWLVSLVSVFRLCVIMIIVRLSVFCKVFIRLMKFWL